MPTKVKNNGHREIAVKRAGGSTSIPVGQAATIDRDLSEEEVQRLEAAGCTLKSVPPNKADQDRMPNDKNKIKS